METRVKRLTVLLLALAACRTAAPRDDPQLTGAASPRAAVEEFLGAIRAQDLQAISEVWGTTRGPARDVVDRDQLEKRELIMQCFFAHDSYQIKGDAPGEKNSRVFLVALTNGRLTRETNFYTVQGPSERWYVERADLEPVKEFCREMPQ